MNIQNYNKRSLSILSLLVLLLLVTSCSPVATFGDQVQVKESFNFYIESGYNRYVTVPEEAYEFILAQPIWTVSDGLSIENTELNISPANVVWTVGDTRYSVKGLNLAVKVQAQVAKNTTTGEKSIFVELPGLPLVANKLGGQPIFPNHPGSFKYPAHLEVTTITVHSPMGKIIDIAKGVLITGVVIVVIFVLIIFSAWLSDQFGYQE